MRLLPSLCYVEKKLTKRVVVCSDVLSLVVALYAIKLTQTKEASAKYSYGWHRAEILAALINGVFLLALCFSIFIEAVERFARVPGEF